MCSCFQTCLGNQLACTTCLGAILMHLSTWFGFLLLQTFNYILQNKFTANFSINLPLLNLDVGDKVNIKNHFFGTCERYYLFVLMLVFWVLIFLGQKFILSFEFRMLNSNQDTKLDKTLAWSYLVEVNHIWHLECLIGMQGQSRCNPMFVGYARDTWEFVDIHAIVEDINKKLGQT
jgi:hypothetical protein